MKILVIRVGRIGDMVMCTPALAALLDNYPRSRFTLLTSAVGKRLLEGFNERLEGFWIYDRSHPLPFLIRRDIRKKVAAGGFDHIFCFESNPSYRSLLRGAAARLHFLEAKADKIHYASLLLDMVSRAVGREVGDYPLYLPSEKSAEKENDEFLRDNGISADTFLIALHPTYSGSGKWWKRRKYGRHRLWPARSFARLGERLAEYGKMNNLDLRVVMNLLPAEMEIGREIRTLSAESIDILCPPPGFSRYRAFLKRTDLLVV
ncbi:MAG: hypothetical protein JXB45_08735, partial [Candidatus Krumholzibacteriota bacterium]|nr:hypothetical protein [Candidatus Krumholzibacteriota bacterium]